MKKHYVHLYTAVEAEEELGKKYFYRQRIYRLAEKGKILTFKRQESTVFIGDHILKAFLTELEEKIQMRFPELDFDKIQVFYSDLNGEKRVFIDGVFGKGISVNADLETEEDLINKLSVITEWVQAEGIAQESEIVEAEPEDIDVEEPEEKLEKERSLKDVMPEEIFWLRVTEKVIEGVEVKSGIFMSLPSIAQFIGIRTDAFITWISQTTFSDKILSSHYKNFQTTQNRVVWEKGVTSGKTPFIPFEHIPEIIVAFRQSGRKPVYPQKAELLYEIAHSTLSAVGLAISGDKQKAADTLAEVGRGLGLNVADQIIGIFRQYESREFQVATNREFASKVKALGEDYAIITGKLTFGITTRSAAAWIAYGASRNLPSKLRKSSREVMRQLSKSDGVGMAFGERHYIKDPNLEEAIRTGRQGKEFYKRLKDVGLLDDLKQETK